jgi:hypothetical protein
MPDVQEGLTTSDGSPAGAGADLSDAQFDRMVADQAAKGAPAPDDAEPAEAYREALAEVAASPDEIRRQVLEPDDSVAAGLTTEGDPAEVDRYGQHRRGSAPDP